MFSHEAKTRRSCSIGPRGSGMHREEKKYGSPFQQLSRQVTRGVTLLGKEALGVLPKVPHTFCDAGLTGGIACCVRCRGLPFPSLLRHARYEDCPHCRPRRDPYPRGGTPLAFRPFAGPGRAACESHEYEGRVAVSRGRLAEPPSRDQSTTPRAAAVANHRRRRSRDHEPAVSRSTTECCRLCEQTAGHPREGGGVTTPAAANTPDTWVGGSSAGGERAEVRDQKTPAATARLSVFLRFLLSRLLAPFTRFQVCGRPLWYTSGVGLTRLWASGSTEMCGGACGHRCRETLAKRRVSDAITTRRPRYRRAPG